MNSHDLGDDESEVKCRRKRLSPPSIIRHHKQSLLHFLDETKPHPQSNNSAEKEKTPLNTPGDDAIIVEDSPDSEDDGISMFGDREYTKMLDDMNECLEPSIRNEPKVKPKSDDLKRKSNHESEFAIVDDCITEEEDSIMSENDIRQSRLRTLVMLKEKKAAGSTTVFNQYSVGGSEGYATNLQQQQLSATTVAVNPTLGSSWAIQRTGEMRLTLRNEKAVVKKRGGMSSSSSFVSQEKYSLKIPMEVAILNGDDESEVKCQRKRLSTSSTTVHHKRCLLHFLEETKAHPQSNNLAEKEKTPLNTPGDDAVIFEDGPDSDDDGISIFGDWEYTKMLDDMNECLEPSIRNEPKVKPKSDDLKRKSNHESEFAIVDDCITEEEDSIMSENDIRQSRLRTLVMLKEKKAAGSTTVFNQYSVGGSEGYATNLQQQQLSATTVAVNPTLGSSWAIQRTGEMRLTLRNEKAVVKKRGGMSSSSSFVSQEKYSLKIPMEVAILNDKADRESKRLGSCFEGYCYLFLKKGSCSCDKFKHEYSPDFMQHMENLPNWELYVNLRFAAKRGFSSFMNNHGMNLLKDLASRKEEKYVLCVLYTICGKKMKSVQWNEILTCMHSFGRTYEKSSKEIFMCLLVNHLHRGKASHYDYDELIDKVVNLCFEFSDTTLVCGFLDGLSRGGFVFYEPTIQKMLHRCLAEASGGEGGEICRRVAKLFTLCHDHSICEPITLQLLADFIQVIGRLDDCLANQLRNFLKEH